MILLWNTVCAQKIFYYLKYTNNQRAFSPNHKKLLTPIVNDPGLSRSKKILNDQTTSNARFIIQKLCFPSALSNCQMPRPGFLPAFCLPLGKGWIKGTLNMSDKPGLLFRFVLRYYLIILILFWCKWWRWPSNSNDNQPVK